MPDSAIDYKDALQSQTCPSAEDSFYWNAMIQRHHYVTVKALQGFCSRLDWQLVLVKESVIFLIAYCFSINLVR